MVFKPENIKATIGTVLFHLIVLVLLLFLALRTPLPLPEEEGVEVNLGYAEQGKGNVQTKIPAPIAPKPRPQTAPKKLNIKAVEPIQTQNTEEAPALPKPEKKVKLKPDPIAQDMEKPKAEKPVQAQPKPQVQETEKPEEKPKEEPKPKVNPALLYKGKAANAQGSSAEGNTQTAGDQGKPTGTVDAQNYEGAGGQGNGIRYSLGNRKAKALPKPSYNSKDQGTVVISILVDKMGNVKRAIKLQKGTTVTDPALIRMAEKAALQAKFTPDKEVQTDLQKGTITYVFRKLN